MALFEDQILLPCPPVALFEFFSRPANVARVADPSLGLKIQTSPDVISVGSRISFQMMAMNQIQSAIHEITEYQPHDWFLEVQIEGPMKSWRHEHRFEEVGGETRMIDRIEFEKPGGIVGLLLSESRIQDMLEENFFQREQELRRLITRGGLS
ncbi:MAG: hypothetical protein DWH91_09315 [Planctomycetota bacterium]|nr:MAG: hypothetical protein DWH91_09315 [Planctomycetota bacterium]